MDWTELIKSPFVWGLALGLLFFFFSAWGHFKTRQEFRRFRKHLSDKLELEAAHLEGLKKEREALQKENEHLRVRLAMLAEKPDQKIMRDLEIFVRAEKRMTVRAPGFAGAWEAAKSEAAEELALEEAGKSLPKRLFHRLFGAPALKWEEPSQEQSVEGTSGTAEGKVETSSAEPSPKTQDTGKAAS